VTATIPEAAVLAVADEIAVSTRYWLGFTRDAVTTAAAREYDRGAFDGYAAAIADIKALQHRLVLNAELEHRRWHVCCGRCRLTHHRDSCRDCQDRDRKTFGQPMRGDYSGQKAAAA
jgi:hypothetical protein